MASPPTPVRARPAGHDWGVPWEPLPSSAETDPSPVGASLDRLVRHLGGPSAGSVGGLFDRWEEVVGAGVADHVRPIAIRDGVLVVGVDDPAWVAQMRFLDADLRARVHDVLGVSVARVEVRVRPSS
jgi:predicted nucleic acid-binding Zn ribbon protein